ncbi:MAG: carboxypeptidase-like regulatory domain-containing protein, partial [Blastocatellia bacterium]
MRFVSIRFLAMLLLLVPATALAQSELGTGAMRGTVQDIHGAAVGGAAITVINVATGLVRNSKSDESGEFTVPVLPAGQYSVKVEIEGFSTLKEDNLIVNVGGTTSLRLEVKPGAVNEVVNVTATSSIDTTKTDQSSLVDRTEINDLPINGRRADQFALLTPGVARDGRFGLLSYHGQSGV